jgi:UDP-GlcNAc:undecaprenyl-phosphate GlcNAc-1-phosphate transferase
LKMNLSVVIAAGLGLGITLLLIPLALWVGKSTVVYERAVDWHHRRSGPVPRIGGAVLVVAFLAIELWIELFHPQLRANTPGRNVIVLSSVAMFALGFWDDLRPIGADWKLTGQILIAGAAWFFGVGIEVWQTPFSHAPIHLGLLGPVVTIVWLVGLTILINQIDGLDGLAGGQCLALMILIVAVASQSGNFGLLASGMAGALVGFLCFNLPPARVYLGDGGAYFLGFQIGLYSIVNSHKGTVPEALIAPLFVLALPITDTVLTAVRRGLHGLPLFRADRKHLHHRLVSDGCSERKAVLCLYGMNLVFLMIGLAAFWSRGKWLLMLPGAAVFLLLLCARTCGFSRHWFAFHEVVRRSITMRTEVRYALSFARWLELESHLSSGPDEFWPNLIFAAEKLGFSSLKLTLRGEQRVWRRPGELSRAIRRRYDCPNGNCGSLELTARACSQGELARFRSCDSKADCTLHRCRCLADPRVFEMISELLAEAWNKAAVYWHRRRIPLRFKPDKTRTTNGFSSQSGASANGIKHFANGSDAQMSEVTVTSRGQGSHVMSDL